MIFTFIFLDFVAFPDRKDSLFYGDNFNSIEIEASGSVGLLKNNICEITSPNATLISDEVIDWCSSVAENINDPSQNPWIQYSIKGKQMKISRFAVRNGGCNYACCCNEEEGKEKNAIEHGLFSTELSKTINSISAK